MTSSPVFSSSNRFYVVVAAVAFVIGVFFRFRDLGGAPLAVDEYFFGTSILNTAAQGIPEFPCEGWYTRGVLIQYLSVPLLFLGASLEFTTRFWPAVASLLTLVAMWRIGRLAGGPKVAAVAVVLGSLSLWEIEFARFGRMYSPFQAVFMWYAYFQILHLVYGSNRARWSYIALSAVSIFVYAGASFLLILNFLALAWRGKRWSLGHLLVSAALLVSGAVFYTTDFRFLGVPAAAAPPAAEDKAGLDLPINLPNLPELALPILVIGLALLLYALLRYRSDIRVSHPSIILWALGFVSLCFGLFVLGLGLLAAGLVLQLPSPVSTIALRKNRVGLAIVVSLTAWLAIVTALFAAGETGIWAGFKEALRYVLGFPDVYWYVVLPWLQAIPATTIILSILALPLVWSLLVTQRDAEGGEWSVRRYCAAALILLLLLTSLFRQPYTLTRYTYFLYPLVLTFVSASIVYASAAWFRSPRWRAAGIAAPVVLLLAIGEDFRLDHLLRINESEFRFRTAYDRQLAGHYYTRWDFRSASQYVNERLAPGDSVIVFDQPLPHYLDRTSGVFIRTGTKNHRLVWGCDGTRDLWSNAPLLDTEQELYRLIDETTGDVWLIVRTDAYPSRDPIERVLPERFALQPEFVTVDEHLAVYRIPAT